MGNIQILAAVFSAMTNTAKNPTAGFDSGV